MEKVGSILCQEQSIDSVLKEIAPIFCFLTSLDKVFNDVYKIQSSVKRREKTVKELH